VVTVFGKSTLGLAYSIFITDALIAPGFPSNTARGGVLYPIILALAQSSGSVPEDENKRRLGGYLMFCGMASLSVSSALWLTATSANPIGVSLAAEHGLQVSFGSWLLVASVPALAAIGPAAAVALPAFSARGDRTPDAPAPRAKRCARWDRCRATSGSRPSTFAVMICAWISPLPPT
jgi:DASS family divalent anion:Na+ symporter